MHLRGIASSVDAGRGWDLRCRLREELVAFIQREFPQHLPRARAEIAMAGSEAQAAQAVRPKRTARA
jgi:hypothetical protein